jgi:Putative transposase
MEPLELLERLAALVPAPRRHVLRYHGTLAPNSKWRSGIVVKAPAENEEVACKSSCKSSPKGEGPRSGWIPWADLLKRVFLEDVLKCPRCSGRMKIIATVTEPEVVRKILRCLALPADPPPAAPAKEREQAELKFEG